MSYEIVASKKYSSPRVLEVGETLADCIDFNLNPKYSYKLRIRGEVNIPFQNRTEDLFPIYFRKIDDSLLKNGNRYTLEFNDYNVAHERSCYFMLTDLSDCDKEYDFSIKAKANGTKNNLKVSAEIYYGNKHSRYYYEKPDGVFEINICDSVDYVKYNQKIKLEKPVDFVMIKISAINFSGTASVFSPEFTCDGKNYIDDFEFAPEKLGNQKWIGEGFSRTERPSFNVKVNGETVYNGMKTDGLHRLSGFEVKIPDSVIKNRNRIEIKYLNDNKIAYAISEVQLITLPRELEILGVQKYQNKGKSFGLFCYFEKPCVIKIETDKDIEFLGEPKVDSGFKVLKFFPNKTGEDMLISISDGKNVETTSITVYEEKTDSVITGSGDFIYINQNTDSFYEYIAWYISEGIGNMLTLRSCYRWGCTAELNKDFWQNAVQIIKDLGLYYVLMVDGRELNGVNANPPVNILKSEYFLGEQTHERDGAFTYWQQDVSEYESFFYHLLSRKLERNGIYGKLSPVYDKQGKARIYYAGDDVSDTETAYHKFVENLRRTTEDGATRHTGVTPLFSAFFDAGYKWLGYESMYGNHEIIFGALRGMSNSVKQNSFGAHLALQWSTAPCDDYAHAVRYKLSLYESFIQGATQINTEEGLWNIENPFEGFDRFSYACNIHKNAQQEFSRFVKSHNRKGRQVRNIAMMVGKFDGMDCFSTGKVFGQNGEFWKYHDPEQSWDLLKVFYPQAKLEAIYHFVKKGGRRGLRIKDKKFLEAWPHLYGGEVLDYQSLGYYSETPYGVIDLISGNAANLSDYSFIFLTGWNTCDEEQLERFCKFMEDGGTLMLAKCHLSDSVDRKEVLTGNASTVKSKYIEVLKSYIAKKRLIFFEEESYPIRFRQEYEKELKKAGELFGSKIIKKCDRVSFTEYMTENGARYFYVLNICWWNDTPAGFIIRLAGNEFNITLNDNNIKMIGVSPNSEYAVMIDGIGVDIETVDNSGAVLKGYGETKITIYGVSGCKEESAFINGVKKINFIR